MSLQARTQVLETLIGRTYAAIPLVDGTTGEPLVVPVELSDLTAHVPGAATPLPLPVVAMRTGLLGLYYPDDVVLAAGKQPTRAELEEPSAHPAAVVSGKLVDPARRYNPTVFEATLDPASDQAPAPIRLFRTPLGTPVTRMGALHGSVGTGAAATREAVPFARVAASFTFQMRLAEPPRTEVIEVETDLAGDFVLPLGRLPVTTGNETTREGTITVRIPSVASPGASGESPLRAANIRRANGTTVAELTVNVRPGAVERVPGGAQRTLVVVPA